MDTQQTLRIRQIRIDGLFGLYDHCINLNLKERVTVLHGPNGVGKTVTLKLIEALLNGDYAEFCRFPFKKFVMAFTDGTELQLTLPEKQGHSYKAINAKLSMPNGDLRNDGDIRIQKSNISPATMRDSQKTSWHIEALHSSVINIFNAGEIIDDGHANAYNQTRDSARLVDEPQWLKEFRTQIGPGKITPHFIATQRLIKFMGSLGTVTTVIEYSNNLISNIEEALAQYSQKSQALDQSFPIRLLSASTNPLQNVELRQRMENIEAQRLEFQQIGLLDAASTMPFDPSKLDELISQEKKVMSLYVEDTEQKLSVLADLARRIKLLLDNINTKFKNKHLHIDREKGFVVTNDAGQELDLDSLSSGEQHEIVLLYDLLFRIKPNTLVLIDEPELSLHVTWQKRFLPDLLKIAEVAQIDVLVATHSPYIVGDHTELMVALETNPRHA